MVQFLTIDCVGDVSGLSVFSDIVHLCSSDIVSSSSSCHAIVMYHTSLWSTFGVMYCRIV